MLSHPILSTTSLSHKVNQTQAVRFSGSMKDLLIHIKTPKFIKTCPFTFAESSPVKRILLEKTPIKLKKPVQSVNLETEQLRDKLKAKNKICRQPAVTLMNGLNISKQSQKQLLHRPIINQIMQAYKNHQSANSHLEQYVQQLQTKYRQLQSHFKQTIVQHRIKQDAFQKQIQNLKSTLTVESSRTIALTNKHCKLRDSFNKLKAQCKRLEKQMGFNIITSLETSKCKTEQDKPIELETTRAHLPFAKNRPKDKSELCEFETSETLDSNTSQYQNLKKQLKVVRIRNDELLKDNILKSRQLKHQLSKELTYQNAIQRLQAQLFAYSHQQLIQQNQFLKSQIKNLLYQLNLNLLALQKMEESYDN